MLLLKTLELKRTRINKLSFPNCVRSKLNHFNINDCGKLMEVLRVVRKQDMVPKMPRIILNEGMEKFERLMKPLLDHFPWTYAHVGVELKFDHQRSCFLKQNLDLAEYHNLEGYLHLLDGFDSSCAPFRSGDAKRDVALVNKASDMVRPELMVAGNWYQLENKGLIRNSY